MRRRFLVLAGVVGLAIALAAALYPLTGNSLLRDTPPAGAASSIAEVAIQLGNDGAANPEHQLIQIFAEIEQHRLGRALELTEALLQRHPNYRLAHLIKGDLLLARSRPLPEFGAPRTADQEKLADLRAEALARLRAYREKPPADHVPRYVLDMHPAQRYAIVVDTTRSRLYLYENRLAQDGRLQLVKDLYVVQGKLGADKFVEGDKRTPLGVYHVTANLSDRKLPDLYGTGAFPINYPNEWDRRQGRGGHGIWLHGTPSDTYARPPKASDGCVVLTNDDLTAIADKLQVGLTPVIISPSIAWVPVKEWQRERDDFRKTLEAWRTDWESRDVERYLSHYSHDFRGGGQDFEAFAAQKRQVNRGKEWIRLKLDQVAMFRHPGKTELMVVSFEQDYRSNNLDSRMKKRQYWLREGDRWKIIYEGNA